MTSPNRMRALIVDDHEMIAQGIAVALEAAGVKTEVTSGPTVDDVLDLARAHEPDVVLLDLQLDGEIGSGFKLLQPLRDLGARVLVVTGVSERATLGECLEQGAVGVASKSEDFDSLVDKIMRAAVGEPVLTSQADYALRDAARERRSDDAERLAPFRELTPREADVLDALIDGQQADAIAEQSYVSISTIRTQIRAILRKLEVNSQLAAVALARDHGWERDGHLRNADHIMTH